ncbi:HDIG domain-containing metalloprotein [Sulfoacidibacillus thermotolerans]|uniref:HAD family hydrolase n=1 Tax=Sulfoacidibacillus thermotolerans TaxID=1765684 RepID=A0A2U3DA16_SULT2|nr:HDIG domain-containing metalloprotein [Sulfoacidibacillus thermotolerans]PWI58102.1 HAD family hydrolase [Sulfoacidibacillus thermotolerans]
MNFRDRERAYQLLLEYTQNKSLIKHALAVEAAMRAYADKFGEDVEEWGVVGLLHDFDYERYPSPEEHTIVGAKILAEAGYPEHVIRAIQAHADYNGIKRETLLERTLFACDELSGFITAVALVRPSKSVFDVDVASVKKKLKDKAFAKGVHREDVYRGAEELGISLDEHIAFVISALQKAADDLELRGTLV